jgi:PBP1b-binding outer membrane lipoprotein LpoB
MKQLLTILMLTFLFAGCSNKKEEKQLTPKEIAVYGNVFRP